jgi:hypothetical protein
MHNHVDLALHGFRPFDKDDWAAYGGCESETPYVLDNGAVMIILDGDVVEVYIGDAMVGEQTIWQSNDLVHGTGPAIAALVAVRVKDGISTGMLAAYLTAFRFKRLQ